MLALVDDDLRLVLVEVTDVQAGDGLDSNLGGLHGVDVAGGGVSGEALVCG